MLIGAQLLCIAVLVLSSAGQTEHRELYVKSTPDQQCPQGHLCLTLLDCLHNASAAFTTNTTLLFLPGNHSAVFSHNVTLVVSNVSNLVLTGPEVGPGEPPQASIWCKYTMQFHFRNTTDLAVRNILFTECGTSLESPEGELFPSLVDLPKPPAALQFNTAKNMSLENVYIIWSYGLGILSLNSLGCCSIINCKLSDNGLTKGIPIIGNAYFAYVLTEMEQNLTKNVFRVSHSEISYSPKHTSTDKIGTSVSDMMIVIHKQYHVDLSILNCTFYHNQGYDAPANLLFDIRGFTHVSVIDSTFENQKSNGYGLSLLSRARDAVSTSRIKLLIYNSTFLGNKGGGFYGIVKSRIFSLQVLNSRFIGKGANIYLYGFYYSKITIVIHDSTFVGGYVPVGGSMLGIYLLDGAFGHIKMEVNHCHFKKNSGYYIGAGFRLMATTRCTQDSMSMSLSDSHFTSNEGGHMTLKLHRGSKVLITSCTFRHGHGGLSGGAISIFVLTMKDQSLLGLWSRNMLVKIVRTTFLNNSAADGGAISMEVVNEVTTLTYIIDCIFLANSAGLHGGAIHIHMRSDKLILNEFYHNVTIENTTISDNSARHGAGVYISSEKVRTVPQFRAVHVLIQYSRFQRNIGAPIAIYYIRTKSVADKSIILYVTFSQFHNNVAVNPLNNLSYDIGIINVKEKESDAYNKLTIEDTEFVGNRGSCIVVSGSQLTLVGKVTFNGNTAFAGAAILLDCQNLFMDQPSVLNLQSNTTVFITNNTAWHFGGGIAVNPVCYDSKQCFYHAPCWNQSSSCTIHLEGNSALMAGNSLYGPSPTYCKPQPSSLFNIAEGFSASEVVLFDPYTVCICTKNFTTSQIHYELEMSRKVRPGQEITVHAVVCTRPLTDTNTYAIRATVLTQSHTGHLGTRQNIQEVTKPCDTLIYSVMTTEKHVTVKLTHDTMSSTQSTSLQLTILPCPQGFQLDSSLKCDCTDYLLSIVPGITCNTTTNLITVPTGVWIGNYTDGKLAAHVNCPLDYCNAGSSINLVQPNLQCTNNRSGVLCGACNTELSLTFGTARCVDSCSNYYLFLIFPLALAGVLLVFLLLKCNLTVSVGTTNALVFYANIIHFNRTIFFPTNNANKFTRVLAVFIAWLNLDLGIETCLHKGMTAYGNTWMQFVFPMYIWVLTLIITYTSRYSVTISKLIGRNSVHVLATLFLLSYAKLLRTVIAAVSPITIRDESGNTHLVWLMDGNVPFLSGKHAALFSMALLTALLYLLPLTLLTLLAPLLQARTQYLLLRWVVRIKPLLDAYQGPYKDKYRYWTGVLLTMRLILFTVFATNTLGDPKINLFSIILAILLYQMCITYVLKNTLNVVLECFYSFNLSVFALAMLLLKALRKDTKHLTWVMVGSAFAMFCFTLIWHLYMYVPIYHETLNMLKSFLKNYRRMQLNSGAGQGYGDHVTPPLARQPAPTTSVIDMKELREPLLTDN